MKHVVSKRTLALLMAGIMLSGCSDDDDNDPLSVPTPQPDEPARQQDARTFSVDQSKLALESLEGTQTDTWTGVMENGAGYLVEVPENWNGMLVMYAHGYRGEGSELTVTPPGIRKWLVDNGYAWAASSYSKNFYDVRTGIEDTNALALAFNDIAAQNGRTLNAPVKTYITGHSMGGHIAAAAVEQETLSTVNNVVSYDGSVPMCGVVAGPMEFDYLQDFTFAAQHIAGRGPTQYPNTDFDTAAINAVLWDVVPSQTQAGVPTQQGLLLENVVRNLSGGDRPIFEYGFRGSYYNVVMGTGGRDGKINGILTEDYPGNADTVYQFDADPALSAEETAFNSEIFRVDGNPEANSLRADGLRWVPEISGEFTVPVVTIHGLGDLYVPFVHEQEYLRRAAANGNDTLLVQRAIRAPGHCDFKPAEEEAAFSAMVEWEQNGVKPSGDVVLDPAVVSDPNYGCTYTSEDRPGLPVCP